MPRKITPVDNGGGTEQIANALQNVSNVLEQKQKADETTYAANELTDFQARMQQHYLDSQNNAQPGAARFTPQFLNDFDTASKQLTDQYTGTRFASPMIAQGMRNMRLHFQEQALSFETLTGRQYRGESIDKNRDTLGTVVRTDPGQLNQSLAQHLTQINESNLPPEDRLRYMKQADKELPFQAAMGAVEKDPYAARDALAKPVKPNAGLESQDPVFSRLTDPATREHVRNYAEAKIAKLEAEGRAKDLELEHHVANQFTDMLDTYTRGLPWAGPMLTKDQLVEVYGQENGAKKYQQLQDAQHFGTTITRMSTTPTDELIRQSKAVEPAVGGPGSADRNRYSDLTQQAIGQVIKERKEDPRQYDIDNKISGAKPLNFSDLSGAISEINTRIGNTQKTDQVLGFKTPPLTVPEAKNLATMLTQATPAQQTAFLGQLRTGIQDDAGFAAVMKQIAPHSPVTAIAGMMLGNNSPSSRPIWYDKQFIPNDQGVQNILRGEALLNPQGAEKGQTEKTGFKSTVDMPPDAELRGRFVRTAGSLFAGQPLLADAYFSAYKAAYAGHLAQNGKQTGQIDGDVSKAALADVFGSKIVRFNGKEMLVPPGMDPSRFPGLVDNAVRASADVALPGARLDLSKYQLRGEVDRSRWPKRKDGTDKGDGYLGVLQRPDGGVSSEISISTELKVDGKNIDFPTLVPTLSQSQLDWLMTHGTNERVPRDIVLTAEAYARQRLAEGRSVWADDQDRRAAAMKPQEWLKNMNGYQLQEVGSAGVGSGRYAIMMGNQQLLYPGSRRPVIVDLRQQYAQGAK